MVFNYIIIAIFDEGWYDLVRVNEQWFLCDPHSDWTYPLNQKELINYGI